MKKRYSAHYWKNLVIGTAVAMAIPALYAPVVLAADHVVSTATSGTYDLPGADSLTVTPSGSITVDTSSSASANAIGVLTNGDLNGSLTNSGTITVDARSLYSDASAWGIDTGELSGEGAYISNSGTINVTANGYDYATAYGVEIDALGAGAYINNSGTIIVKATSIDYTAFAYGIYTGDVGAEAFITNSGTIDVTADGHTSAFAYGIDTGALGAGAYINNSGTINVLADTNDSTASAYGIYTGDLAAAAYIDNSGTITVTAKSNSDYSAEAQGIDTDSLGENAYIDNSGTIIVKATSGDYTAYARGIRTEELEAGAYITNSGTIDVTADGYTSANAWGIKTGYLREDASISNSGTITVKASTDDSEAVAWGIKLGRLDGENAFVVNSGSITLTADGYTGASAFGIHTGDMNYANTFIANSGIITVEANTVDETAYAIGIRTGDLYQGGDYISNSGTINVSASSVFSDASAYGISADSLSVGSYITNSGTITASAPDNNEAYSIYVGYGEGSVFNSGILNGNIYLGDGGEGGGVNLINSGTLAISAGASGYIGGNYDQIDGGIFKIGAFDVDEYGRMDVGSASLEDNANIRVNVTPDNGLLAGDTLEDIIAAETLVANGYNVTDNSLAWRFTALDLGDNTLDLTVTDTGMTSYQAAVQGGGLSSATGLAGVLDEFYIDGAPNDDFDELLYALGSLNSVSEVAAGVSKLQPLLSGGASLAALNALHGTNGLIQSRLGSGSGFSSGDEVSADRHFWIKPFGSWADQDDRDGTIGYDADTYGVALGADTELSSTVRLGAALAYSNSDVESKSTVAPQAVEIDTYQVAVYGSYSINESTDLDFQADIGRGNYDGERTINFGALSSVANSDYDSWNYHLGAGLGHDISIAEKTTFTPSVRVDYTMIDADSYSETGSPFNLNVDSTTTDELVFAVDGKINQTLNDTTSLTANLGLGFDAINDQASLTSSFVGGGASFATNGIDQSPLLLRAGLGLEMNPSSNLEIVTRYDLEARDDFMNHTASVKLRMPF